MADRVGQQFGNYRLVALQERGSLRGLTRTFGVARTTVASWIKKK